MPRRPRSDAPGVVHHVFVRAIDRRDLFLDDRDRRFYLDRLGLVLLEAGATCFAWTLESNHVHLVVRTGEQPLAHAMQRVGTRYGRHFNDRHGRSGYVFESRYGERAVTTDDYLLVLIRYVHRNPIESGRIADLVGLARWPWGGHGALVGAQTAEPFHAVEATLSLFGTAPAPARAALVDWMRDRAPHPPAPVDGQGAREALEALIDAVCAELGADPAVVRAGGRRRSEAEAREAIARRARSELGLRASEIGAALGVTRQALWCRLAGKKLTNRTRPLS